MNAAFPPYAPGYVPVSNHHDALLDDLASQVTMSRDPRRHSRASSTQRSGSAMRVVKPSSASNSPRSATMSNRRRTMIIEGMTPRRQQQQAADYFTTNRACAQVPSGRPMSWHPSTYAQLPQGRIHQQQQQQHHHHHQQHHQLQQPMNTYPLTTPAMYSDQQDMYFSQPQFSPMLTSYSNNTSPASSFSPLPYGYHADSTPYSQFDGWNLQQHAVSQPPAMPNDYPGVTGARAYDHGSSSSGSVKSSLDWNQFIMHGFNSTTPPTPELVAPPQAQPAVSACDASPYQGTVDESDEDEGEVLVGMGLYDLPEKCQADPHLNNYRTTVSSLLGSTFRHGEPRGKGLKLEETWEPPPKSDSDDEEDDDDDSDESEDD